MKPFDHAPELAAYRDEPKQLASGLPGKNAFLRLGFELNGHRSELVTLERRAPLIVQRAIYWDEQMPELPCVYIISNSGGILQGDRQQIEIRLAPGAQAHVTTQAATKIHEMDANYAAQTQEIVLGPGAYLEYLPDPIIPHKHTRFITDTRVTIDPTATLLYSEILMPGRTHYGQGERFAYDLFSSTLRARRPDGSELFTEKFIVEPARLDVRQAGLMGDYDVLGNVLLLAPPECIERVAAEAPATVNADEQWAAGAGRLPNDAGLVYKILGMESQVVHQRVREFWALVRRAAVGCEVPDEFPWR
jgi:urease accessory protein